MLLAAVRCTLVGSCGLLRIRVREEDTHETFIHRCCCAGRRVLLSSAAMAQTIAGQVTDNTGGILPGVTVEATSPALIEGSRVAFTDGAGRYTLIDLRPGVYNLTFSLPGFSTVLVQGQDLPADFTATVNVELSVGALEETVTVSGQAPLVDVQSTARAEVLNRELLDTIPTGNTLQSTAQLITGVKMNRPEVGLTTAAQQTYMSVHGMSPSQVTIQVDGQNMNSIGGDGAVQSYHNHLANQEMVYETSGMSAETSGGGVRINMVPREGGNAQSGQLWFGGSHDRFQKDGLESLSQEVQNRGVTSTEGISMMYDMNLVHGGPLVRDKLWYFGSVRNFQIDKKVTNSFWRFDPNGSIPQDWYFASPRWFDPDPQKLDGTNGTERFPGVDENTISSGLLRLTYQASQNNKFSAHIDRVFKERYANHGSDDDIATAGRWQGSPIYYTGSAKWTSTISSRLLLEAGGSTANEHTVGPEGTVWNGGSNGDGFAQDWEIGPPLRANFGGLASRPVEHSDGVARNWVGVLNVGVQRELFDGFSASFNWYRRDTYDSVLRVNRALGFDDYTGFLLNNPCAANASPGFLSCTQSGGQVPAQISVFNLNPEAAGIADDWVVQNTPTGEDFSEVYNGFETGFNARLGNGSTIFGGWVMERNVFIRCDIPHDPNRLLFCDPRGRNDMVGGVPITQPAYPIPFLQEFKISGTFPLPGNFWISGSAQFYPAQEAVAGGSQDQWGGTHRGGELSGARPYSGNINYNVTPANVMDNLGIARTEGISVPLLPAGQLFYDRLTQIDVSVRRTFTLGNGMRLDLQADMFNIINYQPILNGTNTYGGSLGRASSTIQGRFVQFATNIHW